MFLNDNGYNFSDGTNKVFNHQSMRVFTKWLLHMIIHIYYILYTFTRLFHLLFQPCPLSCPLHSAFSLSRVASTVSAYTSCIISRRIASVFLWTHFFSYSLLTASFYGARNPLNWNSSSRGKYAPSSTTWIAQNSIIEVVFSSSLWNFLSNRIFPILLTHYFFSPEISICFTV